MEHPFIDHFGARAKLGDVVIYRLDKLGADLGKLPFTVKVLLENLLRRLDNFHVSPEDVQALAKWNAANPGEHVLTFLPGRVLMQDLTGIPAIVDLAAMREATAKLGGEPKRVNPLAPVDLVIDHSVQIDMFGSDTAFAFNVEREYERNTERYSFLRWAQQAFDNVRIVPPGSGICHQVNLEYLSTVVARRQIEGETVAFPDTLVGTDSHTTMVNGLGVLGWGVGGIEAEAVLLDQPLEMVTPEVLGFKFTGSLPAGATATDLVLTVTQTLRKKGVVGKFVEFCGDGLSHLALPDRATISNMCPEYGATSALFPVDDETLRYLRLTGRPAELVDLVERYTKEQGLFRTPGSADPQFTELVELDLGTVEPSLAGPRRPQDRVGLSGVRQNFHDAFPNGQTGVDIEIGSERAHVANGSVAIAAITSCTNTSNPSVLIGAGLLAKRAVERGLRVKPAVKTSLAPGSRVVRDYLVEAGLLPYLEALGFHVVGYGCTTCIGNSGPLPEAVSNAIQEQDMAVAAVLSGNRNFEGRIHPQVKAAYLASPPLVVAYALAGTVDIDLSKEPIGKDRAGTDVYLRDIWPSPQEVSESLSKAVTPDLFQHEYSHITEGDEHWKSIKIPEGSLWQGDPSSTYVQIPPYFEGMTMEPGAVGDITGARVLVMLGDSVTTDHISPAGSIPKDSPAAKFLIENGVEPRDFNSYGARRGNDKVMVRGTFGNIRLKNKLTPDKEGDWTVHLPGGEVMRIYDASMKYQAAGTPLLAIVGQEYGSGSSRDWAAKGTMLLGIKAVIAETYERIHRSNLVGMGVLPLQFKPGENAASLGLTGRETYDITGVAEGARPGGEVTVRAKADDGSVKAFQARVRIDTPAEIKYYQHGGILPAVVRDMLHSSS
ncbi:MAG TPA: aconitate hydratase AcnA [Chloroflexota bacterium]|nr:aconitate hydratase AcnA [Chloroflexota bacterium]